MRDFDACTPRARRPELVGGQHDADSAIIKVYSGIPRDVAEESDAVTRRGLASRRSLAVSGFQSP